MVENQSFFLKKEAHGFCLAFSTPRGECGKGGAAVRTPRSAAAASQLVPQGRQRDAQPRRHGGLQRGSEGLQLGGARHPSHAIADPNGGGHS